MPAFLSDNQAVLTAMPMGVCKTVSFKTQTVDGLNTMQLQSCNETPSSWHAKTLGVDGLLSSAQDTSGHKVDCNATASANSHHGQSPQQNCPRMSHSTCGRSVIRIECA